VLAAQPRCVDAIDVDSRRSAAAPLRIHLAAGAAPDRPPAPREAAPYAAGPRDGGAGPGVAAARGGDAAAGEAQGASDPGTAGGGGGAGRPGAAAVRGDEATARGQGGPAAGGGVGDAACVERVAPCLLPERSQARPRAGRLAGPRV
jgi:hypothetical protein